MTKAEIEAFVLENGTEQALMARWTDEPDAHRCRACRGIVLFKTIIRDGVRMVDGRCDDGKFRYMPFEEWKRRIEAEEGE